MVLYCATTNPGKLKEFRLAAGHYGAGFYRLEPLPGLAEIPPAEENGTTFEENAEAKAIYYSRFTGELVLSDDSGLEVDALEGAPGIHSAYFSGPEATAESNNRLLLEKLRGVVNRSARFVCVAVLARGGKVIRSFRGEVEGELLEQGRGGHGFGYDPLFYYPSFALTLAEVEGARKLEVSHRGRALALLFDYLKREAARPAGQP